mgnify:CR=1 FL=1
MTLNPILGIPQLIARASSTINSKLDLLLQPNQRTRYLAFLRVYLAFHICKKLVFAWPHLNVLYAQNSFAKWSDCLWMDVVSSSWVHLHYELVNVALMGAAICMGLGLGRRLAVIAVYSLMVILQQTNGFCLDGGDNLLSFIMLYLCFCNSFEFLSISKPNYKSENVRKLDNLFTNLASASMIMHLLLAYFISGFSKANSEVWYKGTATYYILLNERFCGTSLNPLVVQNAYFVTISTYTTLLWEISFPLLIFNKRLRLPLMAIGIMMHLGIYVFMMINEFQFVFMMLYGLFFTNTELLAAMYKIKRLFIHSRPPEFVPQTTPTA